MDSSTRSPTNKTEEATFSSRKKPRCVIVPGNGCSGETKSCNWYGWAIEALNKTGLFSEVIAPNMPSPLLAEREVWLPFLLKKIHVDDGNTVIIGHSSGAVAAMRLLETTKIAGVVLVAACHTDLGCISEARAHYYPASETSKSCGDGGPWKWKEIRENAGFIVQFHSTDDRFIPVSEARFVAKQLGILTKTDVSVRGKYCEFTDRDHFFRPFPELVEVMRDFM